MKEKKKINKKDIIDKILLGIVALVCAFVSIFGLVKGSKPNTLDNTPKTSIKSLHPDTNGNLLSNNILNWSLTEGTYNGVVVSKVAENTYSFVGTATSNSNLSFPIHLDANTFYNLYITNSSLTTGSNSMFTLPYVSNSSGTVSFMSAQYSFAASLKKNYLDRDTYLYTYLEGGQTYNISYQLMIVKSSSSRNPANFYEPYNYIYYSQENYNTYGSNCFSQGVQSAQNVINADIVRNNMTYLSHGWESGYDGVDISTPFTAHPKYATIDFNYECETRAKVLNNVSYDNIVLLTNYPGKFDILDQKQSACYRLPSAVSNKGLVAFHFNFQCHATNDQTYYLNLYHYFNSSADSCVISSGSTSGFYTVNQCFNSNYLSSNYISYVNSNKTFYLSDGIDLFINKIKDDYQADIDYMQFQSFSIYKDTDNSNKSETLHEYIDLFFNVQYNNSSLMYSTGYEKGYNNGYLNGGYDTKHNDYGNLTRQELEQNAVANYVNEHTEPFNLADLMTDIFDYPYTLIKNGFDVEFAGINIGQIVIFIVGALVAVYIIKKVVR